MRYGCAIIVLLLTAACTQPMATVEDHSNAFYGLGAQPKKKQASTQPSYTAPQSNAIITGETRKVRVVKGDTLFSISEQYKVPIASIITENNLKKPYTIYTGQYLTLRKPKTYTVLKGDTLFGISRTLGVDVNKLASINQLKSPYTLEVGDQLILPEKRFTPVLEQATIRSKPADTTIPVNKPTRMAKKAPNTPSRKHSPAKASYKSTFIWPARGKVLSTFGAKGNGIYNDGITVALPVGSAVRASRDGKVVYVGNGLTGYGNLTIVKHGSGWLTAYGHQHAVFVKQGQRVKQGEVIGESGATGKVDKPQLFFALRKGRKAINPLNKLPK